MPTTTKATARLALSYVDPDGAASAAPAITVQAPFEGQTHGSIDVPDLAADGTEYNVSFGSVNEATLVLLKNNTGQDLLARVNDAPSASGTLISGVKVITLASAVGDRLVVELTTSGGTPGILSVEYTSPTTVTVKSWLALTGIQASDTSVVKVYNYGKGHTHCIPSGGMFMPQCAPAAAGDHPVTAISLLLTEAQDGKGTIGTHVFGDPVA